MHLQPLDPLELRNVAGDKRGVETSGLGRDEEIERTDDFAGRFERGSNVSIVQRGIESKISEPEKAEERLEPGSVMRMRFEYFSSRPSRVRQPQ